MIYDVIIIGGGASGMMSAIIAGKRGLNCLIIDHNEKLGKKLYITGKGRCNLTNNSSIENHLNNIISNSKFMYSALNCFSPKDTMEFFSNAGLELKTERGNRVFPKSDKSSDVIKALTNLLKINKVNIELNKTILDINKNNDLFYIKCENNNIYTSRSVIIATGGLSYSGTGASDLGYKIARTFGHKIVEVKSALCPIIIKDDISVLNGLSLKNVTLSIKVGNKTIKSEIGEMLFTYNSLTGPLALTMSSKINRLNLENLSAIIDFKPALTDEELKEKFTREFAEYAKKDLRTYLLTLLPRSIVDYFICHVKIQNKKIADINKEDKLKLINGLKRFDLKIKSLDNINVGIVTAGGVDVKEINSKTCESKLIKNLYFVGEVLDLDALTGGFNLQIAWSTGYLAGKNVLG